MKAKVAACETPQDIFAVVQDSGFELSDTQLDSISGGSWEDCFTCNNGFAP